MAELAYAEVMSDSSEIRVGTEERERAMAALSKHFSAGRLSLAEFEDRSHLVVQARNRGDLTAVLSDLPADEVAVAADAAGDSGAAVAWSTGWDWRAAVVGVMPFVALALFFLTDTWLWFLMIPASGALLYGAAGRHRGTHDERPGNNAEDA